MGPQLYTQCAVGGYLTTYFPHVRDVSTQRRRSLRAKYKMKVTATRELFYRNKQEVNEYPCTSPTKRKSN
jgi:hypothetical protein